MQPKEGFTPFPHHWIPQGSCDIMAFCRPLSADGAYEITVEIEAAQ
jgi:hypothetical protein